jgi:hypothetical protein
MPDADDEYRSSSSSESTTDIGLPASNDETTNASSTSSMAVITAVDAEDPDELAGTR